VEVHQFILELVLILVSARFFGELFSHLNLPPVLGEVLAGIVIGPSLLGLVVVVITTLVPPFLLRYLFSLEEE
jgi:Kef-type K+ transport system membrane component KefB